MKDKRVYSKCYDKVSNINMIGIFQIIFAYHNSATTASLILVVLLIKFNETHGQITTNNMIQSCSDLTTLSRQTLTNNLQYNSANKQDHLYELKLYKKNNYLKKAKLTEITQNEKRITNRGIESVVENKKNGTDRNLVTAKWKFKAVNSITSLQAKFVDHQLNHNTSKEINANPEMNSSSVQFIPGKELLMTDNTGRTKTTFEKKLVRLPRKIMQVLISTYSKYEYYSKKLNYTSKVRKLRNNTKLKLRKNTTSRLIGKCVRNIKVTKNLKATERALNTTYDTIYFNKEQDRTLYKSIVMKRKYQNKNRINRTNYIKKLRKQIKSDILMNPNFYGILPYFDKASFGVTLLKDKLKKIISTRKIPDKSNSSIINLNSSIARRIVTTYKSKNEYYATLAKKLIDDYFTKQKITTISINLKVPDIYDNDDDEDKKKVVSEYLGWVIYDYISSYNHFMSNYSNDVYKFTHGVTSWNNINNIIALHLHTIPPTQKGAITCYISCKLKTMPTICPTRKRPVRILVEDFALPQNTVFEMVWMGLLIVLFVLFCCGTPIFLLEQVKKKKIAACVDES